MKKIFGALFLSALLVSCGSEKKELKITVENTGDFDRITQLVEIPLSEIQSKLPLDKNATYVVLNEKGDTLTSQMTHDQKLIFESGLKAKQSSKFSIVTSEKAINYDSKVYGRLISERYDDFAWENDRVAFRIYGAALIPIDGPSNGIDVWFKRTPNLVIDKWYKDDIAGVASYHADHGEGLDDYKVGRSLGAGAMAPYVDNKLWLNKNFASQELLDNGPLRMTVKLKYNDFDVNGKNVGETRTFSIDAGSQLSKVTEEFTTDQAMQVAAGMTKRAESDSIIVSPQNTYVIYDEPKRENDGDVYMGLVFPQGFESVTVDTYTIENEKTKKPETHSHVLAIANYKSGTPITYYTGYGWSKYGFPTDLDFQKYLENFVKSIKNPLVITYK